MNLAHNHPDCTGLWYPHWFGGKLYWHCGGCSAAVSHCDAIARTALKENKLGTTLRQLADAGQEILDAQGREW